MKNRVGFLKELSWLDYLMLIIVTFFFISYDVLTVKYLPNGVSKLNIPELYGFPLPNKTNYNWCSEGERLIYVIPFIIDYFTYFALLTVSYWFIVIYVLQMKLRKKIFLPIFFGILFVSLIPYITPAQKYSFYLTEYPSSWYDWHINWFSDQKLD
jgi:hypothetical protein